MSPTARKLVKETAILAVVYWIGYGAWIALAELGAPVDWIGGAVVVAAYVGAMAFLVYRYVALRRADRERRQRSG